jgi:hypothetical protein
MNDAGIPDASEEHIVSIFGVHVLVVDEPTRP